MCKKSAVISLGMVFLCAMGSVIEASLVAHYKLDEGTGAIASDSSGNGRDGVLLGSPQWVSGAGDSGVAVAFDPAACTGIECPPFDPTDGTGQFTFTIWALWDGTETNHHFFTKSDGWGQTTMMFQLELWGGHSSDTYFNRVGISYDPDSIPFYIMPKEEWTHLAFVYDGSDIAVYLNGVDDMGPQPLTLGPAVDARTVIGVADNDDRVWTGVLDDVQIYSRPLTEAEVLAVMEGNVGLSTKPQPEDGATDVSLDVMLGWTAGEFAATHDLYLGTVFDDVNDADRSNPMDVLIGQGQDATVYAPVGLLELGQTYYWRVDEVNAAPDYTIFKGDLWSFTVEPVGYPIANILATSNTTSSDSEGPQNAVDGSGLNELDQHSIDAPDMWLGMPGDEPVYIQFEFDRPYQLHEILVWNYNVLFEPVLGFGLKDVTVEYSTDGAEWVVLSDVELLQAAAQADYTANTTVDFGGVTAQFVRITVYSSYGVRGQFGLSEVRFLCIPVQARYPEPVSGAMNVSVSTGLGWRAGRGAVTHEVYLSADEAAVAEGAALVDTVSESGYMPDALDFGATYYWKITEIQEVDSWEGDIWSFSTQAYLVVDDFESYDDEDDRIYLAWVDGYEIDDNGSQVGNLDAPFAEMTIVHDGRQSMPLFFDNTGAAMSEAEFTFGAQDWTANGLQSLSLFFQGAQGNGGQLYVKINGTKILYEGDAGDIARVTWQPWNIDLSAVGGNLSGITSLAIGIEGAGSSGVVYIDDIRLYARTPEFITPVEPDTAGLVVQYAFEEGSGVVAIDSSGNGNDGTIDGNPTWVDGASGRALDFDGSRDYVTTGESLLDGLTEFTIAFWLKGDLSLGNRSGLVGQNDCIEYGISAGNNIQIWSDGGGVVDLTWPYDADADWHHIVAVGDGSVVTIYLDAREAVSGGTAITDTYGSSAFPVNIAGGGVFDEADNWFTGQIDEVYIYQRALSAGEVAGLAGRTEPLAKPF